MRLPRPSQEVSIGASEDSYTSVSISLSYFGLKSVNSYDSILVMKQLTGLKKGPFLHNGSNGSGKTFSKLIFVKTMLQKCEYHSHKEMPIFLGGSEYPSPV